MPRNQKRSKPVRKHTASSNISLLTIALVSIGIILIALSFSWQFYKARVLSFSRSELPVAVETQPASIPQHLTIPDLAISLAVSPAEIKNDVWEISETGASYLVNSAVPGNGGNIIMYGHNKTNLLGNLKKAVIGQIIFITTTDGALHGYTIQEIKTVTPNDVEAIQPTQEEVLTLYTCTGLLDSKRLIVKAIPQNY